MDNISRTLVDYLLGFGYSLVIPPLVENLDTLLGSDGDGSLGERTLRLTDPYGGEPIGIRADITPQIARIDERHFASGVNRLCYCGSTLYSRPAKPWLNREQLQVGAEIFGCKQLPAAIEILMVATGALAKAGVKDICVAMGHAGIVDEAMAVFPADKIPHLKSLLQKKDLTSIGDLVGKKGLDKIRKLTEMHGSPKMIGKWEKGLPKTKRAKEATRHLAEIASLLKKYGIECTLDLTALSGYEYHNGVAFAILGGNSILAKGGHYGSDRRPACGFSVNVRDFVPLVETAGAATQFASERNFQDAAWRDKVDELIDAGMQCVLVDSLKNAPKSSKRLVKQAGKWQIRKA